MRFGAYSCDSVPTGPAKYGKIKKFRPVVCKVLKLAIDTEKIQIFWPLLSWEINLARTLVVMHLL